MDEENTTPDWLKGVIGLVNTATTVYGAKTASDAEKAKAKAAAANKGKTGSTTPLLLIGGAVLAVVVLVLFLKR